MGVKRWKIFGLNPLKIGSHCNKLKDRKMEVDIVSIPLKSGHIVMTN